MRAWKYSAAHGGDFGVHVTGQSDGDPLALWMVEYVAKGKVVIIRKLIQKGTGSGLTTDPCPRVFNDKAKCDRGHTHTEYKTEVRIPVAYDPSDVYRYREAIDAMMVAIVKARWPHAEWSE